MGDGATGARLLEGVGVGVDAADAQTIRHDGLVIVVLFLFFLGGRW